MSPSGTTACGSTAWSSHGPNGGPAPGRRRRSSWSTASPVRRTTSCSRSTPWPADRRVVTLDQRGHGQSTRSCPIEDYTIDQLTADLIAFLDDGGRRPGRSAGPLHGRQGRDGRGPAPARPRALTDPDGHQRLVVHARRRRARRSRPHLHGRLRSLRRHAGRAALRRTRGHADRRGRAGGVAAGEGRHLRRHGPLRRQRAGHGAHGRRRGGGATPRRAAAPSRAPRR